MKIPWVVWGGPNSELSRKKRIMVIRHILLSLQMGCAQRPTTLSLACRAILDAHLIKSIHLLALWPFLAFSAVLKAFFALRSYRKSLYFLNVLGRDTILSECFRLKYGTFRLFWVEIWYFSTVLGRNTILFECFGSKYNTFRKFWVEI